MTFGRETGVYTRTKDGKMAVRMVLANRNESNNGGGNIGEELTQEQYEELSQWIQKLNNRTASLESQIDELQSTVESLDFIVKQTSSLQRSIILRINDLEKEVFGVRRVTMRYKLKPLILEAVQFKDDIVSITEITRLSDADVSVDYSQDPPIVLLQGSNQILKAREGDYIVKGVAGEIYVLPERVFIQVFDPIE